MALIKCSECSCEISTKAKSCPKCGAAAKPKTSIITWLVLIFIVFAVISNIASGPETKSSPPQIAKSKENDEKTKEFLWIEKGKESVKARLKDPESAEFRGSYFSRGSVNIPVSCGEVNSKNSFGGYSGFQRYISAGDAEKTYLEADVTDFSVLWEKMCSSK